MSQDARIGGWPDYTNKKTLEECQSLLGGLPILKQLSERRWLYELGDRRMSIDLSHVNEQGEPDGQDGCNALDTHVPRAHAQSGGAMWAYTQLRLRLAAAFGWAVLDLHGGDVYRPLPLAEVSPLPVLPDKAAKGSVPVGLLAWTEAAAAVRYRKKDRLVAKSEPRKSYSDLIALDDERLLHGYKGGSFVTDVPGIQIRAGDDLACRDELVGGGRVLALRADREALLSDGPLSQGRQAHVRVYGLSPLQARSAAPMPLCPPFAWVPGAESFLAVVPRTNASEQDFDHSPPSAVVGGNRLLISGESVDAHPWLREALDPARHHLIEVDDTAQSWRSVIGQAPFAEIFGSYEGSVIDRLVLSPDGQRLYVSDRNSIVACFDRADERWVWQVDLHESMRVYALALSPCGRYLAAGGLAEDRSCPESFSLLDTDTGQFVYRLPVSETFRSAVYTIVWHPDGTYLVLGLATGTIVELGLDGDSRFFKGLKGGIAAICFRGERMLVTGAENVVRAWMTQRGLDA